MVSIFSSDSTKKHISQNVLWDISAPGDSSGHCSFDFIFGWQSWIIFYDILHNVFVIVRKITFTSHTVVLMDITEPDVSTFEHMEGYLKLEPAQFYTVDLLFNCPQLHCADEVKFSSSFNRWYCHSVLYFPANHTCPLPASLRCLVCVCVANRCMWRSSSPVDLNYEFFKVLFDCQDFLVSALTECVVSWVTRIMTLLGECGPKDCNWRQQWQSVFIRTLWTRQ